MKRSLIFLVGIVSLLIVPLAAFAGDTLQGEAFTDPDYVQRMPAGWQNQPIRHDPEFGQVDLVVTLDQHLYEFLPRAIQQYAGKHKLKIAISDGTCGITAGKLVRKTADIGGYCCPPGMTDRLPGLRFHTLGILPIQILVHPDNPIDNVTLKQAREIFQGRIYRWSELKDSRGKPGPDLVIQTIGRLHCKIRPGHWRLLLDNEDLFGPRLQEVGTIPDMISLVANAPDAVGYEVGMMAELYRNEGMVKFLTIDGQSPTTANLLAGRYPLYRTLNLTTWKGETVENPEADRLVAYLLSLGDQLEKQYDLVPAAALRKAGWQFRGNELIGEPG
jgi:phosphate transport system substrate-binding protein